MELFINLTSIALIFLSGMYSFWIIGLKIMEEAKFRDYWTKLLYVVVALLLGCHGIIWK